MKIALWSDGTWCEYNDVEEYINTGFSDDFIIKEISNDHYNNEEELEEYILTLK